MTNKIIIAVAGLGTISSVYLGVRVNVLETELNANKSAARAVEKFELAIMAQSGSTARAQREAELKQREEISRDLHSIPDVLLEGR